MESDVIGKATGLAGSPQATAVTAPGHTHMTQFPTVQTKRAEDRRCFHQNLTAAVGGNSQVPVSSEKIHMGFASPLVEYYSARNRDRVLLYAIVWVDLRTVGLSNSCQARKAKRV